MQSRYALLVLFCVGLLLTQIAHAQAPALLWSTNVGASVFAVDSQTNVYVSANGTVIELTSAGVPVQTNVLSQFGGRAQRDAAGNFYFAGMRPGYFSALAYQYGGTNGFFLTKFNPAGTLISSNAFGPTNFYRLIDITDLQIDTNGSAYVGYVHKQFQSDLSARVAKLDATGSNVWTLTNSSFGENGVIHAGNVSPTNGYALSYENTHNTANIWSVALSRFDSNGTPTAITTNWITPFGPTPPLAQDAFGNFYTSEGGGGYGAVSLIKRGPQGNVIWADNLGNTNCSVVGTDFYGGVHVADIYSNLLRRYDSDGNLVWTLNLPAGCAGLFLDSSGNRFVSLMDGSVGRLGPETFSPPTITNSPQPQTVFVGSNATFSVGATGLSPMHYFWFSNGSLVSSQTSPSLTLSNVTANQTGSYYVIVSNAVNTATSAPVQLRVKQVELYVGNQLMTNGTYTFTTNPVFTVRSAFTNGSAFYTLDGSAPNFSSTFYSGPFPLFTNATVRALGYSADFSQSEEADVVNAVVVAHHSLMALTSGGGTINLNPPGGDYLSSDTVTATAAPNPGWSFLYWTGDASGSSNSVDVVMHTDKTIHAVFGTTLSTTVQGNGQVLLYPPGGVYSYGHIVRLTGVPGAGSYFGFWGNAATGNTNPLYFKVTNANPTVSSIFGTNGANQVTLTVNINGRGDVSASPQANVYSTGQSLTLTATPAAGQTFVNWTGDASGTQNPLNVVLNQSEVINANFTGGPMLRVSPQLGEGLHPEGFQFSLLSDPDSIYEIRRSSNFIAWDSLGFVTNHLGEASLLDTNAVTAPRRFYQIKP